MSTVVVMVAAMLALVVLSRFYETGMCLECGGRGGHRRDCPSNDR